MLTSVLQKETCAACRFCCAFRRESQWETPLVTEAFTKRYPTDANGHPIAYRHSVGAAGDYATVDLTARYRTTDPGEEAPCPFLDAHKGCMLPEADKPFDCKIWPLRYMRMPDESLAVCLTPTCPALGETPSAALRALVADGLGETIAAFADENPYIIKDYHAGFPVLCVLRSR